MSWARNYLHPGTWPFWGVHLDQEGRIIYGNPFGKLRLDVN